MNQAYSRLSTTHGHITDCSPNPEQRIEGFHSPVSFLCFFRLLHLGYSLSQQGGILCHGVLHCFEESRHQSGLRSYIAWAELSDSPAQACTREDSVPGMAALLEAPSVALLETFLFLTPSVWKHALCCLCQGFGPPSWPGKGTSFHLSSPLQGL